MKKTLFSSRCAAAILVSITLAWTNNSVAELPPLPTPPTNFQVMAVVSTPTSCSITTGDLAFDNYNQLDASQAKTTLVTINCSNGRGYSLYPNNGVNPDAGTRRMAYGANYLNYALFQHNGDILQWNISNPLTGTGSGINQIYTVYGSLPTGQTVPGGTYLDTVMMTVEYTP